MIQASCHTDDYAIELDFDAEPFFQQAEDWELLQLARSTGAAIIRPTQWRSPWKRRTQGLPKCSLISGATASVHALTHLDSNAMLIQRTLMGGWSNIGLTCLNGLKGETSDLRKMKA